MQPVGAKQRPQPKRDPQDDRRLGLPGDDAVGASAVHDLEPRGPGADRLVAQVRVAVVARVEDDRDLSMRDGRGAERRDDDRREQPAAHARYAALKASQIAWRLFSRSGVVSRIS